MTPKYHLSDSNPLHNQLAHVLSDIQHLGQDLGHEIQARFGLMAHVTSGTLSQPQAEGQNPLVQSLLAMNESLEEAHYRLKTMRIGSREEAYVLSDIQALEMKRFQLLSKLNGQSLDDYNLLPLKF